ncbi:MAG: lipoate--protein ligase, partial [Caldithrix sp.]|nr:lipoate--protein ligase [Caldithrix sp.]
MDPLIYIDNHDQTNPYLNLALEEYAVRHLDVSRHAYLFLYVNDPCVVVGKHQNVLEEVNLKTAAQYHIPVIRRISGGGAVYHDQGNLNFSYITRHTLKDFNNYRKFLQPIIEVLESYGLHIDITERNNLHVDGNKVSGNAQFSSREHMLSHGTLLVDSDISSMQALLKTSLSQRFHSRSTKSISSTVTNLADHTALPFSIPGLKNDLIKVLCGSNPAYHTFSEPELQTIRSWAINRYQSWAWNYG